MKNEKICPHCKKRFERKTNAQKYCSETCRNQAILIKKKRLVKCAFCKAWFEADNSSGFCSTKCMEKAAYMPKSLKRRKPRISLEEVARLSREAGLTYGKYVQLHGI